MIFFIQNNVFLIFELDFLSNGLLYHLSKENLVKLAVIENTEVIDHNDNWAHLQYVQAYCIKVMSPVINIGLKVSKERQLFK